MIIRPINTKGKSAVITGPYSDSHPGIDYAYPDGEPVYASESGTVVIANTTETRQWLANQESDPYKLPNGKRALRTADYGNMLKIQHDNGYSTLYAHLRYGSIIPRIGTFVKKGQKIAEVGSTGNSTGNHLHWEVREDDKAINPGPLTDTSFTEYFINSAPADNTSMTDQEKKDIESMKRLREYNGVFYEAKHVIEYIEKLTAERNNLGLEISKKDDKIKELEKQLDDGNDWKSKYDTLELNTDERIKAERDKAIIDMEAQLKIQHNSFIQEHALELNDLRGKIETLENREPTKIIEKETPLEDRFAGKPLKEKVLACIDILFSKPQKNEK